MAAAKEPQVPPVEPHARLRQLAQECEVVVFDLDGVVREFGLGTTETVAATVGVSTTQFLRVAFAPDLLRPVVTGRTTFVTWCEQIRAELVARGTDEAVARAAVEAWVADRGVPVAETVDLIAELRAGGRTVLVFTNGTDNVPAELHQLGLGHLVEGLLNSADFGVAKPDPRAYAAAHHALETHLGATVERSRVLFTDDRADNVAAAAEFGWQAVHFDAAVRTQT